MPSGRRGATCSRARPRRRLCVFAAAAARGGAGAGRAITPALIEAAQEGRQGRLLHRDGSAGRREARQGVRGEISRHRGRGSSAPAPSACSSASARKWRATSTPCDVVNSADAVALHRLEAQGLARALSARGGRQAFPDRLLRSGRALRHDARLALLARLQHQSGEGRGRAEELRRPARSEMDGQDGQGASGLQRHHHDRDLPDRARRSAGTISRSSPSRR